MPAQTILDLVVFSLGSLYCGYEAYRALTKRDVELPLGMILGALIGAGLGLMVRLTIVGAILGSFIGNNLAKPRRIAGEKASIAGSFYALLSLALLVFTLWLLSLPR